MAKNEINMPKREQVNSGRFLQDLSDAQVEQLIEALEGYLINVKEKAKPLNLS